MESRGVCVRVS